MRPHGVQVEHAATQKNRSHQTQILVRLFLENDGGGGDGGGGDGGDEVRVCVQAWGPMCKGYSGADSGTICWVNLVWVSAGDLQFMPEKRYYIT